MSPPDDTARPAEADWRPARGRGPEIAALLQAGTAVEFRSRPDAARACRMAVEFRARGPGLRRLGRPGPLLIDVGGGK